MSVCRFIHKPIHMSSIYAGLVIFCAIVTDLTIQMLYDLKQGACSISPVAGRCRWCQPLIFVSASGTGLCMDRASCSGLWCRSVFRSTIPVSVPVSAIFLYHSPCPTLFPSQHLCLYPCLCTFPLPVRLSKIKHFLYPPRTPVSATQCPHRLRFPDCRNADHYLGRCTTHVYCTPVYTHVLHACLHACQHTCQHTSPLRTCPLHTCAHICLHTCLHTCQHTCQHI